MTQDTAWQTLISGHNVFLTGEAGSGKTFLLKKFIKHLKEQNIVVGVTASTGIAATHIGGMTIHSWCGMGIADFLTEDQIKKIASKDKIKDRIKKTKVLIIDEISMLDGPRLDMIDAICQKIKGHDEPFGGIQVILCGDLFQLPPIGRNGETPKFVFESEAWKDLGLKICYLSEQHRQTDDGLLKVLNDIRSSDPDEGSFERISQRLNGNISSMIKTKLYTHNFDVDRVNDTELDKINSDGKVYEMRAKGLLDLVVNLRKSCLAPETLLLKIGAKVMFVKNNFDKGFVNGTLGEVIGFSENNNPIVQTFDGKEIVVEPESWAIEEDEKVVASVTQIPLRLAWAITVHKSQGMTLDGAEMDLSKCFVPGMGYVALSRVRSLSGIKLLGINNMAFMVDEKISNFDKELKKSSKMWEGEIEGQKVSRSES